jgi:uncharacterized repeat protein (TIGR04138 family)
MDAEQEVKLEAIVEHDPRYRVEAYLFVLEALKLTIGRSGRSRGHVSAAELLAGIRELGLRQYGPLTKAVFNHWGIKQSSQFGDIVFNMIHVGMLGKRDDDRREDFNQAAFDLDTDLDDWDL